MKVLIWAGMYIVIAIINEFVGLAIGIKAGFVILFAITFFVSRSLCEKWDNHKKEKKSIKEEAERILECNYCGYEGKNISEVCPRCGKYIKPNSHREKEIIKKNVEICFCRRCGAKLLEKAEFCNKCGTEVKR